MSGLTLQGWQAVVAIVGTATTVLGALGTWIVKYKNRGVGKHLLRTWPTRGPDESDIVVELFNGSEKDIGLHRVLVDLSMGLRGKRSHLTLPAISPLPETITPLKPATGRFAVVPVATAGGFRKDNNDSPAYYRVVVRLGSGRTVTSGWAPLPPDRTITPNYGGGNTEPDW